MIFHWKKATGSPRIPVHPTPLCCPCSNVLLCYLLSPTSQYLSRKGHICESSGVTSIPYSCKNHCMERKEHFLDWESPDTFPNRTSEQHCCSGELQPIKESAGGQQRWDACGLWTSGLHHTPPSLTWLLWNVVLPLLVEYTQLELSSEMCVWVRGKAQSWCCASTRIRRPFYSWLGPTQHQPPPSPCALGLRQQQAGGFDIGCWGSQSLLDS